MINGKLLSLSQMRPDETSNRGASIHIGVKHYEMILTQGIDFSETESMPAN
jgi:hypothetical protein